MAFQHGKNTEVWIGGVNRSTYFNSVEFSADVDTAETTTFTKEWKTHIPGLVGATIELGGLYDPAFTDITDVLTVDAGDTLRIYPEGSGASKSYRECTIKSTSYAESAPVGDVIAFSWSVIADGEVTFGTTAP